MFGKTAYLKLVLGITLELDITLKYPFKKNNGPARLCGLEVFNYCCVLQEAYYLLHHRLSFLSFLRFGGLDTGPHF